MTLEGIGLTLGFLIHLVRESLSAFKICKRIAGDTYVPVRLENLLHLLFQNASAPREVSHLLHLGQKLVLHLPHGSADLHLCELLFAMHEFSEVVEMSVAIKATRTSKIQDLPSLLHGESFDLLGQGRLSN